MPFDTLTEFRALLETCPNHNAGALAGAAARNGQLTKPPGALGRLEDLALWFASWNGAEQPRLTAPQVLIFAGNHGVAARGVSAFPAEVTAQMVANFEAGGAAINQLCAEFGATMSVIPLELDNPTADFTQEPALTEAEFLRAIKQGWNAVDETADLLVAGEMGIGNTTAAAALAASLTDGDAEQWVGRGTGVDDAGLAVKRAVVSDSIALFSALHAGSVDPLQALRHFGGREMVAMFGAFARARHLGLPVLLDGFICSSVALVMHKLEPRLLDNVVAAHQSAEIAHVKILGIMKKDPLLSLNLRLGEGSGAALAIGILRGALACHSGMATFAQAGVSDG